MIARITKLLDFSSWSFYEVNQLTPMTDEELLEKESLLTESCDDLSQFDHVRIVITYKLKIKELSK